MSDGSVTISADAEEFRPALGQQFVRAKILQAADFLDQDGLAFGRIPGLQELVEGGIGLLQVDARVVTQAFRDQLPFGVQVLDVRVKRVDYQPEVSESVYRRMEAERKRVANERRSEGFAESEKLRADAERKREVTIAGAYRDAQKAKGEGDAKAASIYAEAFNQDANFYGFYRSLDVYRSGFKNKNDLMLLDPNSEFFKYLKSPPSQLK